MDFMEMLEKNEKQRTENGAVGYKTSGKKLVDLNYAIPSFRETIDTELFDNALDEDKNLALRWLLYLRDIREGVGERKSFRDFVIYMLDNFKALGIEFSSIVPIEEYGRWDDVTFIAYKTTNTKARTVLLRRVKNQLDKDLDAYNMNKPISLLSKWLQSENSSSKETKQIGKLVREFLGYTPKQYRKLLSKLRAYSNVIEVKTSANRWNEIDYNTVPSKANLKYANAFMNHDAERRVEYLNALQRGEAKINAQAMFLHDIVHAYVLNSWGNQNSELNATLEALWDAQEKVEGFKDTIVVRDGSGSMTCTIPNSRVLALDVADAISIYCAENNDGAFKNKIITFSSSPQLLNITRYKTLRDKLLYLHKHDEYTNTDIEKVFMLILDTAVKNKVKQEDMPKSVLIISDGEWDAQTSVHVNGRYRTPNASLFENLAKRYKEVGYDLPKLIFWNVNSRTNTIPIQENKNGVILLSGFSKNLMSMIMSSEIDPYKALVEELKKPRYDVIDKIAS